MINNKKSIPLNKLSNISSESTELKKKHNRKKSDKGNLGEKGETNVIKNIFNLIKNKNIDKLELLFGTKIDDIDEMFIYDIFRNKKITKEEEIIKSKSISKSDICININKNKYTCSIKCLHGSPPAILNHTPRSAKVFQSGELNEELDTLDSIIKIMNDMRHNGFVGEDININKIKINKNQKKCLINTIKYFIFDGSGRGSSKYPANSILEIKDPCDINTWKFYNCIDEKNKDEYVLKIFDKLVLSLRDKGMPAKKNVLCDP